MDFFKGQPLEAVRAALTQEEKERWGKPEISQEEENALIDAALAASREENEPRYQALRALLPSSREFIEEGLRWLRFSEAEKQEIRDGVKELEDKERQLVLG